MSTSTKNDFNHSTSRLEAFSDGVFAISITLLVLNIIEIPRPHGEVKILAKTFFHHWPVFLAYLIGFLTILVCWINHHFVCTYVRRCNNVLYIINGLLLLVVSIVPFVTVVLADYILDPEREEAIRLYGTTYFVMASSYFIIWAYVHFKNMLDGNMDVRKRKAVYRMYLIGVLYTALSLVMTFVSFKISLVLYAFLFIAFFIPEYFTKALMKFQEAEEPREPGQPAVESDLQLS